MMNIKVGDVVHNVKQGGIYIVVGISEGKVYLHDEPGKDFIYGFNNQFVVVSEAERAEFMSKYKRPSKRGAKPPSPKMTAEILARFDQFKTDLNKDYPKISSQFLAIWAEMLGVVGSVPGQDWGMSKKATDVEGIYAYNPVLKTRNPKTERAVDLMQVFADAADGTQLYLIIICASLPQEFSHLFKEKGTYWGNGDGARLNYSDLNSNALQPYLECIRNIVARDRSAF